MHFKQELINMDVPFQLENEIYSFLGSCTTFSHLYVPDAFRANWLAFKRTIRWKPNGTTINKCCARLMKKIC